MATALDTFRATEMPDERGQLGWAKLHPVSLYPQMMGESKGPSQSSDFTRYWESVDPEFLRQAVERTAMGPFSREPSPTVFGDFLDPTDQSWQKGLPAPDGNMELFKPSTYEKIHINEPDMPGFFGDTQYQWQHSLMTNGRGDRFTRLLGENRTLDEAGDPVNNKAPLPERVLEAGKYDPADLGRPIEEPIFHVSRQNLRGVVQADPPKRVFGHSHAIHDGTTGTTHELSDIRRQIARQTFDAGGTPEDIPFKGTATELSQQTPSGEVPGFRYDSNDEAGVPTSSWTTEPGNIEFMEGKNKIYRPDPTAEMADPNSSLIGQFLTDPGQEGLPEYRIANDVPVRNVGTVRFHNTWDQGAGETIQAMTSDAYIHPNQQQFPFMRRFANFKGGVGLKALAPLALFGALAAQDPAEAALSAVPLYPGTSPIAPEQLQDARSYYDPSKEYWDKRGKLNYGN